MKAHSNVKNGKQISRHVKNKTNFLLLIYTYYYFLNNIILYYDDIVNTKIS